MSVVTLWSIPKHVIAAQFSGDLTFEDLQDFATDIETLLKTGRPPVHVTIDFSKVSEPYTGTKIFASALTVLQDPAIGWVVSYANANRVTAFLMSFTAQALKLRSKMFETESEAFQFLLDRDSRLESYLSAIDPEFQSAYLTPDYTGT